MKGLRKLRNASSARSNLVQYANRNNLQIVDNEGNGDCQFLAIEHQLAYHFDEQHSVAELRGMAFTFLVDHPNLVRKCVTLILTVYNTYFSIQLSLIYLRD